MSRYIDVDELKEMIEARAEMLVEGKEAFYYIANWLNKLPPADVTEIVRCKDCRYFQDRYIELPDGSKRPYEKGKDIVPLSVGINVGSYCTRI